jgi:transposase
MLENELHRHYGQLLGVESPWRVESVDLNLEKQYVEIEVTWTPGQAVICPVCEGSCRIKDHLEERVWRHLDTMQFETRIRCRVPRSDCPEHGVKAVQVPWAEPGSRFTRLFERFAIDVLLASRSVSQATDLLRISWDQAHRIMARAVERGVDRRELDRVQYVGMDEKSFGRGQSYISVLTDLEGSRVLEVSEGRDREAADVLWETLPEEQLDQILAVALDMSETYLKSAQDAVPNAAIVHDKFHISKHLNEAVAKVHREENRSLQSQGDERLKGTRNLWLYNPANFNQEQEASFDQLKNKALKVARAWGIKELFADFWTYCYERSARKFFKKWFGWASRSRLKAIVKVAKMIKNHFENIITYLKHPITNAVTEGLNSKIQTLKSNARGFRSFLNYRTRILFFCGKLSLYPQ